MNAPVDESKVAVPLVIRGALPFATAIAIVVVESLQMAAAKLDTSAGS